MCASTHEVSSACEEIFASGCDFLASGCVGDSFVVYAVSIPVAVVIREFIEIGPLPALLLVALVLIFLEPPLAVATVG